MVIAIMLMGAGYAAWQSTLEIETTVNTGSFKMKYTQNDSETYHEDFRIDAEGNYVTHTNITDANNEYWDLNSVHDVLTKSGQHDSTQTTDDNNQSAKFTYRFDKIFPGIKTSSSLYIENVGSVPAKITGVNLRFIDDNDNEVDVSTFDEQIKQYMSIRIDHVQNNSNSSIIHEINLKRTLRFNTADLATLNDLLDDYYMDRVIEPGENNKVKICLEHYFHPEATGGMDEGFISELSFEFTQQNVVDLNYIDQDANNE